MVLKIKDGDVRCSEIISCFQIRCHQYKLKIKRETSKQKKRKNWQKKPHTFGSAPNKLGQSGDRKQRLFLSPNNINNAHL